MARWKKRKVEGEVSTSEKIENQKKKSKPIVPKSQENLKNNVSQTEIRDELIEPKRRVLPRRAAKKQFQLYPASDNEPKMKKAKVACKNVLLSKKSVLEQETTSDNSTDSGISLSDTRDRKKSAKHPSMVGTNFVTSVLENYPNLKKSKIILERLEINCEKYSEEKCPRTDPSMEMNHLPKINTPEAKDFCPRRSDSSGIGEECSSSESEWEEVEENVEQNLDDYKPEIPKEGVEITIGCPDLKQQRRKNRLLEKMEYIRLHINRQRKEAQLNVHKTHLLCFLAHGFHINDILNSEFFKAIALSLLPSDLLSMTNRKKVDKVGSSGIGKIVEWFRSTFSFTTEKHSEKSIFVNLSESMVDYFSNRVSSNSSEYNLMFIVFARCLGFKTRFCVSFYPVSHKAQNLLKKSGNKLLAAETEPSKPTKEENVKDDNKELKNKKSCKKKCSRQIQRSADLSRTQKQEVELKSNGRKNPKCSRPRRSVGKSYKISSDESDDDPDDEDFKIFGADESDEDFEKPKIVRKITSKPPKRTPNRKILSSDSEPSSPKVAGFESDNVLCWAEIYSKPDKRWISIDCVHNIIDNPYAIESNAPKPVVYIVTYDNDSSVKDVTRRYCDDYMTSTIKLRPDLKWWEKTLEPFLPLQSKLDKEEENSLETMLINKPLPHTIAGFKNHPLYALRRHLLKFEAIYPPDAETLGFMRGEAVYPRECICLLHTREKWVKEARVVRVGETPYKVVKCLRWDKINRVILRDVPTDLFGFWQTEPYEPPTAVNGIVPRNEYGNVDLFKHSMLPKGTVYLQNAGLNRIARKMGIDCSPAIIGFEAKRGGPHPVFDGFVICEEFKEKLLAAWEEEQEIDRIKQAEKKEKRIYGNWKKLIRGLLIRERIKLKYDVK